MLDVYQYSVHRQELFPTTRIPSFLLFQNLLPSLYAAMDSLVTQYSRPAFENEGYSKEEQLELSETTPPLSLRFALPPLANVRCLQ